MRNKDHHSANDKSECAILELFCPRSSLNFSANFLTLKCIRASKETQSTHHTITHTTLPTSEIFAMVHISKEDCQKRSSINYIFTHSTTVHKYCVPVE